MSLLQRFFPSATNSRNSSHQPCACLPTLGCGLVILGSIFAPPQWGSTALQWTAATSSPTHLTPLSAPTCALCLVGWLACVAAFAVAVDGDCVVVSTVTQWWRARQEKRAAEERLRQQKQAVLDELVSTGLLSHMMRNPHSRILPYVLAHGH